MTIGTGSRDNIKSKVGILGTIIALLSTLLSPAAVKAGILIDSISDSSSWQNISPDAYPQERGIAGIAVCFIGDGRHLYRMGIIACFAKSDAANVNDSVDWFCCKWPGTNAWESDLYGENLPTGGGIGHFIKPINTNWQTIVGSQDDFNMYYLEFDVSDLPTPTDEGQLQMAVITQADGPDAGIGLANRRAGPAQVDKFGNPLHDGSSYFRYYSILPQLPTVLTNMITSPYGAYYVSTGVDPITSTNIIVTNGIFSGTFVGIGGGKTVVIQSSTNSSDWIPIQTNLTTLPSLTFTVPIDTNLQACFFRASIQQ